MIINSKKIEDIKKNSAIVELEGELEKQELQSVLLNALQSNTATGIRIKNVSVPILAAAIFAAKTSSRYTEIFIDEMKSETNTTLKSLHHLKDIKHWSISSNQEDIINTIIQSIQSHTQIEKISCTVENIHLVRRELSKTKINIVPTILSTQTSSKQESPTPTIVQPSPLLSSQTNGLKMSHIKKYTQLLVQQHCFTFSNQNLKNLLQQPQTTIKLSSNNQLKAGLLLNAYEIPVREILRMPSDKAKELITKLETTVQELATENDKLRLLITEQEQYLGMSLQSLGK